MQSSQADRSNRMRIVSMGSVAFFVCALASQAWVQTIGANDIQRRAEATKRFVLTRTDLPKRGIIKSSDGQVLASDEQLYSLNLNLAKVPKSDGFFMDLGEAAGISGAEVREMGQRKGDKVSWANCLSEEAKQRVEAVKAKWRADGVSADPVGKRMYPLGASTSSIVGLLRADEASKGLEKYYAAQLGGSPGVLRGLVDRSGAFLPTRMEAGGKPRVDGADIELTIDSQLQLVAFDAVKKTVERHHADSGVALAMDLRTGDVLAMANWPTFDPESGQGPDGKPADLNPAVMSRFEPGSTMKVLTQAKAIEDGLVSPSWTLNCTGVLKKGPYTIKCDAHHGNRAHGVVNLEKAISASCNVSAATWATLIGYQNYRRFVEDLGLLDSIDVGLPGTTKGNLPLHHYAQTHDLMCWGFGQSMGVTPLALGAAFCALGNDGLWMRPRLVKSVGGQENPVREGRRVFSPNTTKQVMSYMEEVFASKQGTAYSLRIPGYRLAGKTGTAQRQGRGGGYVSNFVGILPADKPQIMILVMIDHPTQRGYYGAVVAGPVFRDLALAVIRRNAIPPSSGTQTGMPVPKVEVEVER